MTASLYLTDVTNAIAAISVSGVTIHDVDQIGVSYQQTANVLIPNPNQDGFITGFQMRFDSIMQGTYAPMTIAYTLNYRFLGTRIGDMANFTTAYADVVSKTVAIINAIFATPAPYSGRIEMTLGAVSIGAKIDPSGNAFHGADFALNISELQN